MKKLSNLNKFKTAKQMKANLDGSGWDATIHDAELQDPLYVYLLDPFDTGFIYAMSVSQSNVDSARSIKKSVDNLAMMLGSLIKDNEVNSDKLVGVTIAYFVKTQTYLELKKRMMSTENRVPVVVILRYASPIHKEQSLRPFVVMDDTGIVSPEELSQIIYPVISSDKAQHPDWFPSARVVPFTLK